MDRVPHACQALFAEMEQFSRRFSSLTDTNGIATLIHLPSLHASLDDEAARSFLTNLLSPDEALLHEGFTFPKRRLEWFGGRLAAKYCLCGLVDTPRLAPLKFREFSILPDGKGRPILKQPSPRHGAGAVSISHSHEYAAALAVNRGLCGIDIQLQSAQLARVQERITSEKEQALLNRVADPLTRLGMIWTTKEAVKKSHLAEHSSFFGAIELTEVVYDPHAAVWTIRCRVEGDQSARVEVRLTQFDTYHIACTMGEQDA